ncbi:MAG: hypothetical protein JWM89_3693 [Acidimicrobiales bacterium]|nr:hypothetical protein [Acidimicrobiales bacterium]
MTTPNDPRNDPFRGLDSVEPPDRWDEIVARAELADDAVLAPELGDHGRGVRRPVFLAAAVLSLIGAVAGVALVARDPADHQRQGVETAGPQSDPPTAMWGRAWQVVRIERDGTDVPVVPAAIEAIDRTSGDTAGPFPLRLHAENTGVVGFNGCNGSGGPAHLDGDVLVPDGEWAHEQRGCHVKGLMDQEAWLQTFLLSRVHVTVSGERLTLSKGHDMIEMDDVRGLDAPEGIWGHSWEVTRFVVDGRKSEHVTEHPGPTGPLEDWVGVPVRFTFQEARQSDPKGMATGSLRLAGCNRIHTQPDGVSIRTDHLVVDGFVTHDMLCNDSPPPAMATFFQTGPTIELRGEHLVLRSGTSSMEATRVTGADPAGDPAGTTTTRTATSTTTARPGGTVTTSPDTPVSRPTSSSPPEGGTTFAVAGFFGERWTVTKVMEGGAGYRFPGAVIDASQPGMVVVPGCNGAGGPMRLEGSRLVPSGQWAHTAVGCPSPTDGGPDLEARDAWFERFLSDGPTIGAFHDGADGSTTTTLLTDTATVTITHS